MPTMHRISCFRDDIIFVVYLYQRYIYRVDKTRGLYATEQKDQKKVEAASDGAKVGESKEKEAEIQGKSEKIKEDEG